MRFAILALASTAMAWPSLFSRQGSTGTTCLAKSDAKLMVDVYQRLIANYTAADCTKYCSDDFADYSDSINSFIFEPLGGPTFATKKIFMDAQLSNPPFPLVVDGIDAVDCDVIALRWHATFGEAMKPSRGLTILHTTKKTGSWQISRIDVEFNSLTWLLDMGGNYTWTG